MVSFLDADSGGVASLRAWSPYLSRRLSPSEDREIPEHKDILKASQTQPAIALSKKWVQRMVFGIIGSIQAGYLLACADPSTAEAWISLEIEPAVSCRLAEKDGLRRIGLPTFWSPESVLPQRRPCATLAGCLLVLIPGMFCVWGEAVAHHHGPPSSCISGSRQRYRDTSPP